MLVTSDSTPFFDFNDVCADKCHVSNKKIFFNIFKKNRITKEITHHCWYEKNVNWLISPSTTSAVQTPSKLNLFMTEAVII